MRERENKREQERTREGEQERTDISTHETAFKNVRGSVYFQGHLNVALPSNKILKLPETEPNVRRAGGRAQRHQWKRCGRKGEEDKKLYICIYNMFGCLQLQTGDRKR